MVPDTGSPIDDALAPMPAGPLHWLRAGALEVAIAPDAGGRIAQLRYAGVDWLIDAGEGTEATIAWGCYPMVPWAGRIRYGRFTFDGTPYALPTNFGDHAIHGLGFSRPWQLDSLGEDTATLSLRLPEDTYWPFGGMATQTLHVHGNSLHLELSVQAGDHPMPAALGWHPWFRKPDRLHFVPDSMYPQDEAGIAILPRITPKPGPWDDCFISKGDIALEFASQRLTLRANTDHWVIYDGPQHATCIEPQTGPPDAFTLAPVSLTPGQTLTLTFDLTWQPA